ncbi:MAG: hypothetical protein IKB02_05175 [Clostridia bacterium]|nr:hypothetical protein [Clostridia bacterium]
MKEMERIERRAKAIQMIYETPELREFVAYVLLNEKHLELKKYTNIANFIKNTYHCEDSSSSIFAKIKSVAYEDIEPSVLDFLLSKIVNSEPEEVYLSAMSHLYYWFRQLDWDNFTSDASTPLKDVKLLLKGVRKEFKDIAAKDL